MRTCTERWKLTLTVAGALLAIGLATADAYVDLAQPADVCRVRQANGALPASTPTGLLHDEKSGKYST